MLTPRLFNITTAALLFKTNSDPRIVLGGSNSLLLAGMSRCAGSELLLPIDAGFNRAVRIKSIS
jgi:hypothetical protein